MKISAPVCVIIRSCALMKVMVQRSEVIRAENVTSLYVLHVAYLHIAIFSCQSTSTRPRPRVLDHAHVCWKYIASHRKVPVVFLTITQTVLEQLLTLFVPLEAGISSLWRSYKIYSNAIVFPHYLVKSGKTIKWKSKVTMDLCGILL